MRPPVTRPAPSGAKPLEAAHETCPLAPWGCRSTLPQPHWRLVSEHATSDGHVEYCRCSCAAFVILREGEVAAFTAPDRARGVSSGSGQQ
ncbi:hypothetical protein [Streptomyces sp. NPDC005301]|uniref:hypothetical protein n=1 Tax=unclassified Streptomyces TaxID=2593676 RepID=UPI0033A5B82E